MLARYPEREVPARRITCLGLASLYRTGDLEVDAEGFATRGALADALRRIGCVSEALAKKLVAVAPEGRGLNVFEIPKKHPLAD